MSISCIKNLLAKNTVNGYPNENNVRHFRSNQTPFANVLINQFVLSLSSVHTPQRQKVSPCLTHARTLALGSFSSNSSFLANNHSNPYHLPKPSATNPSARTIPSLNQIAAAGSFYRGLIPSLFTSKFHSFSLIKIYCMSF
jgi:hypothetical protein